jgi:hypothetical protein
MLPFDLQISQKTYPPLLIGGIEIPAYGSVTPNESMAYTKIVDSDSDPMLFHFDVICLFIASRKQHDLESTKRLLGDIPLHVFEAAYEWVKQEFQQWKNFDADAEKKTQSQTGEQYSGDSSSDTPTSQDLTLETLGTAQST